MEGEGNRNRQYNGEHCFTFIIYSTLVNVGFGHGSYFTDGNLYPFLIKKIQRMTTKESEKGKGYILFSFFLLKKKAKRSVFLKKTERWSTSLQCFCFWYQTEVCMNG